MVSVLSGIYVGQQTFVIRKLSERNIKGTDLFFDDPDRDKAIGTNATHLFSQEMCRGKTGSEAVSRCANPLGVNSLGWDFMWSGHSTWLQNTTKCCLTCGQKSTAALDIMRALRVLVPETRSNLT